MTIRKWDAEIRAWLDGAELELECPGSGNWESHLTLNPMTDDDVNWRVKISDEDAAVEKWHKESQIAYNANQRSYDCFREGFRAAKARYVNTTY